MEEPVISDGFWTVEKQEKLCALWRENAAIFNPRNSSNRMSRNRTLQDFADALGCNRNEVKRRMMNMRTQYAREKKKAVKVWHFYHHLRFLDSYNILPGSRHLQETFLQPGSEIPVERNHSMSLGQIGNRVSSSSVMNARRIVEQASARAAALHMAKRKRREEVKEPFVIREKPHDQPGCSSGPVAAKISRVSKPQAATSSENEDMHDVYAKYIACEIRSISDPQLQRLAKLRIQQVLYEVQNEPASPIISDIFTQGAGAFVAQTVETSPFSTLSSPSAHSENDSYPSLVQRSKFET